MKQKLRELRLRNNLTQEELANMISTTKQTIYKYETGIITNIPSDKIELLAKALKTTPSYLMGWDEKINISLPSKTKIVKIPIYQEISCGTGSFVEDNVVDYITVPEEMVKASGDYFAQYAIGDSMTGSGINEGDLLIFEKTIYIDSSQIGSFCIDENTSVCKKYYRSKDMITLQSTNDAYEPIIIHPGDWFTVIGKLVLVLKKY